MTRVRFPLPLQVALGFALASGAAGAQQAPPVLDSLQAMQAAMETLASAYGPEDATIGAVEFDEVGRTWQVPVDRGAGKSPRMFVIAVDEASGAICAHEPAMNQCLAHGDVSGLIKGQRDKRIALDEAAKHPPPDLQGVMVALIRYQLTTENAYLRDMRLPMYVSMQPLADGKPLDLSPKAIRLLGDAGMQFFPGSTWVQPKEDARMGSSIRMWTGLPTRRDDGDYDVQYGFWCGTLCASDHAAVLRHDGTAWHVVSSVMNSIS